MPSPPPPQPHTRRSTYTHRSPSCHCAGTERWLRPRGPKAGTVRGMRCLTSPTHALSATHAFIPPPPRPRNTRLPWYCMVVPLGYFAEKFLVADGIAVARDTRRLGLFWLFLSLSPSLPLSLLPSCPYPSPLPLSVSLSFISSTEDWPLSLTDKTGVHGMLYCTSQKNTCLLPLPTKFVRCLSLARGPIWIGICVPRRWACAYHETERARETERGGGGGGRESRSRRYVTYKTFSLRIRGWGAKTGAQHHRFFGNGR